MALAVTLAAAVVAFVTREQAIRQEALATSRELAAGATAQLPIDPELGVLLAAEALRRAPTAEAERPRGRALCALAGAGHPARRRRGRQPPWPTAPGASC